MFLHHVFVESEPAHDQKITALCGVLVTLQRDTAQQRGDVSERFEGLQRPLSDQPPCPCHVQCRDAGQHHFSWRCVEVHCRALGQHSDKWLQALHCGR